MNTGNWFQLALIIVQALAGFFMGRKLKLRLKPKATPKNKEKYNMADITNSVPDASDANAKLLAAFFAAGKQAAADGWQPGQDVPALLTAAVADLLPVFQAIPQLQADWKADPFGVILALASEFKKVL